VETVESTETEIEIIEDNYQESYVAECAPVEESVLVEVEEVVAEAKIFVPSEASDELAITRVSEDELVMLAQTLAAEGGDCSYTQQACVVWTVLNRVDSCDWPNSVSENLTMPSQFAYYESKPYRDDHYQVVLDVVKSWESGERFLDAKFQYFYGDMKRNHFYGIVDGVKTEEFIPD